MSETREHRDFTRVGIHIEAKIETEDGDISGILDDISLNGVFLETDNPFPEGTHCDLTLRLHGGEDDLVVPVKGVVVRSSAEGMGVEFEAIELDAYEHLRNLVLYNASSKSEAEHIEEELDGAVGIKRPHTE